MRQKLTHVLLSLLLTIGVCLPARAQLAGSSIQNGSTAPTGACISGSTYTAADTGLLWTCKGNTWQLPAKLILTSPYTNASSSMTNVTGLSFPVAASTNYALICYLVYQVTSGTTVAQFQFTGPSAPSSIVYTAQFQTAPNTPAFSVPAAATAFSSALGASSISTSTNLTTILYLGIINGSNAGTVQLQGAAQVTGTLTIAAGSWCTIQ
jgi:hypothetical protein